MTVYDVEIRIRDRVGVVNEVAGAMQSAGTPLLSHQARVVKERSGAEISVFRGRVEADEPGMQDLRRRLSRIKGFQRFTLIA